ncbi:hypothetical protein [Microbacterium sp. USHLN272]|uniref:hypothetical protein n=1 Tax=Microbacterium sp. USHLN272 TaxID=3081287 RepID=UPI0030191A32
MPIKRTLTKHELEAHWRKGNRWVNAFTTFTFLTAEEREVLQTSLDSNETTEDFLARFGSDLAEVDRDVLTSECDLARNRRISAARRRDLETRWREEDEAALVRERQPVSPTNPFGAYLDPRHDNPPEYPAMGHTQIARLEEAEQNYTQAAQLLDDALEAMTDDFADAFAKEDERRAVKERMKNTANPQILQDHRKIMNRIG